MWSVLWLLACGSPDPETLSSAHTEPTVALNPDEEVITWSSLEGILKKGDVAFPPVLSGLELGQTEAEARAVLTRATHKKFPLPDEVTVDDILAVAAILEGYHEAAATLLIRDGVLVQVDVSLPPKDATFLAEMAWGAPHGLIQGKNPVPDATWTNGDLSVRLMLRQRRANLKYTITGAPPLVPTEEQ